ncbi:N-acyl-D-aspartate/D-glutamate deacylase [Sphingobium xenophagum]|uniref:N-acyl-D-aspartate/D-glutamate deacylase n=1 Tax=Sphingobium xenophagum TaxID=121428 RepID=A0ABU1X4H1_SPHXE|nr:amidohydrolase family protein [Sphingobium xenophagum]MDR7156486.1 N-acyl-D-aspartate/D-glutamate deacylase [Sphingobium xenophagum]
MSQLYDLILRNGTIVDGGGGAAFVGDVAIAGSRIAAVGRVYVTAPEEIDATGKLVTPGFVDVHTHYDGQVTWENRLMPSSNHGVTTVVMGNCGVGFAPVRVHEREITIKLMEGVEDIPEVVMAAGVPFNWETFPQYLDALAERETDIDFATQVPHSPLRVYVMGKRGADMEAPTSDELDQMTNLTADAIRAGAIGVSTSLNMVHRFRDGRSAPSVLTQADEVLALAQGLRDAGSGVFQLIGNSELSKEDQFDMLRRIAQTSGRPVSFTFAQSPQQPGEWRWTLAELAEANRNGMEIRGQVIPRPPAIMMGLELLFHPFSLHPSFQPLIDLPLADKVEAMRDPAMRRRLLSEKPVDSNPHFLNIVAEHDLLFPLGDPPNYHPSAEESVGAIARRQGREPLDVVYDLLLLRDGREILYRPLGNLEGERFESAGRNMLKSEHTILGLGDGGAHYSSICDAAYPTYFLTYWSRDAAPDRKVELPEAIHQLSRQPAVAMGLLDRGLVREGMKADLNVIDLDALHLYAPLPTYDLPTGGRRLSQRADGYVATIVSGKVTYREGEHTGALPGRLVRGQRN